MIRAERRRSSTPTRAVRPTCSPRSRPSIIDPFLYVETGGRRVAVISLARRRATVRAGRRRRGRRPRRATAATSCMPPAGRRVDVDARGLAACVPRGLGVARRARAVGLPARARRPPARGRRRAASSTPTRFEARRRRQDRRRSSTGIRRAQRGRRRRDGASPRDLIHAVRRRPDLRGGAVGDAGDLRRARQRRCPTTSSSGPTSRAPPGHDTGPRARSAPGDGVIVDIWPRDRASRCWADMTRTFVAGGVEPPTPSCAEYWELTAPGARGRHRRRCAPGAHGRDAQRHRLGGLRARRASRPRAPPPGRRHATASSTASATASGSTSTRRPGLGLLRRRARRRRRHHARAGLLPPGLRRRAARGPGARHRGRLRGPDGLSVRPLMICAVRRRW